MNLANDMNAWREAVLELDRYVERTESVDTATIDTLFEKAWLPTLLPEFSLYGSEQVIHQRLGQFDTASVQEIWGGMTMPDKLGFMQQIDNELITSGDPNFMAARYPWVQDGYGGVSQNSEAYYKERLKIVKGNRAVQTGSAKNRLRIIEKYGLKPKVVASLDLVRSLVTYMDQRKAWMMRTRRYLRRCVERAADKHDTTIERVEHSTIERLAAGNLSPLCGGTYLHEQFYDLNADEASLAWEWYVAFRASHSVLKGVTASGGGRHFINGHVFIAHSPQDAMPDDSILVVPFTSPSYVPLMRNARGARNRPRGHDVACGYRRPGVRTTVYRGHETGHKVTQERRQSGAGPS